MFEREINNIVKEIIGEYFPNHDDLRVRISNYNVDVLVGISEDDYIADVLVNEYELEELVDELYDEFYNQRISVGRIRLIKVDPEKRRYDVWRMNSNLIYAC